MKARLMRHEGKSKINVPAEVSRYFDPGLMDYVQQELTPATVIEFDLAAGTKYGGYPVRKDVLVPVHAQKPLYDKGFRFVKQEDETAFLKERERIDAEIKRRADAAAVKPEVPAEEPKQEAEADVEPSGELVIGEPVETPAKSEPRNKRTRVAPGDPTEGGNS